MNRNTSKENQAMTDTNHRAQAQRNDGPLSGVRVIDLTTVGMGPYATQIFGDMGADVIKVEPPERDIFRHALPTRSPRMGAPFMNFNRNKPSVCLDIKQADDRQALFDLVKDRSEEHTSELQSLMRISYAVFCLKKK